MVFLTEILQVKVTVRAAGKEQVRIIGPLTGAFIRGLNYYFCSTLSSAILLFFKMVLLFLVVKYLVIPSTCKNILFICREPKRCAAPQLHLEGDAVPWLAVVVPYYAN